MLARLLTVVCRIGFKKTAVRMAYLMEPFGFMNDDAQYFLYFVSTGLPVCSECDLPILSDTEPRHAVCREAIRFEEEYNAEMAVLDAEMLREAAEHLQELMDSFCTEEGCYEMAVNWTGKCTAHDTTCDLCWRDPCDCIVLDEDVEDDCRMCGFPVSQCDCQQECSNGCGQPAYACPCAELASLRRHNATPLEERCGPWTA